MMMMLMTMLMTMMMMMLLADARSNLPDHPLKFSVLAGALDQIDEVYWLHVDALASDRKLGYGCNMSS